MIVTAMTVLEHGEKSIHRGNVYVTENHVCHVCVTKHHVGHVCVTE